MGVVSAKSQMIIKKKKTLRFLKVNIYFHIVKLVVHAVEVAYILAYISIFIFSLASHWVCIAKLHFNLTKYYFFSSWNDTTKNVQCELIYWKYEYQLYFSGCLMLRIYDWSPVTTAFSIKITIHRMYA